MSASDLPAGTSGAGLGQTGARTYAELGIAGVAFVIGGLFLFVVQPRRRAAVTFSTEIAAKRELSPNEVWARWGRPALPDNAAEEHSRRLQRAQRRQSTPRRATAKPDPYPHLNAVVTKLRESERVA